MVLTYRRLLSRDTTQKSQQSHHRCGLATQQRSASLSARLLAATCFCFRFIRNKEKAEKGKERGDRQFVEKKTFITAKERVVSRLGGRNKNVPTKQYESAVSLSGQPRRATEEAARDCDPRRTPHQS